LILGRDQIGVERRLDTETGFLLFRFTGKHYAVNLDDDDRLPVMVPRSEKVLRPTPVERTLKLRKHLVGALRALREARHPQRMASPVRPEPSGMAAQVAGVACSLCKGFCCKGGGDDAYLDERTMARVRQARPELDARGIIRLYTESVPARSYEASCLFHGKQGCMLSRDVRSDVCNSYFCRGLEDYIQGDDRTTPVIVIAGEGEKMRTARTPS
jgi:hypothetical protein